MQQGQQVADAQPLHALDEVIANRRGTSGNQETALDEIPVFEVSQIEALAQRRLQRAQHAGIILVAGDRLIVGRRIKELVKEVLDVRCIFLRLRIRLRYADQLQES